MGFLSNKNKYISEINVTPFVDVMLVLLIIFMVTAPMMIQGENVELPESGSGSIAGESVKWVITITKEGDYFFNDEKIGVDYLSDFLKNKLKSEKTPPEVFIKGDKSTLYGNVVAAMSEIKSAGIENVGMITVPVSKD
ncbi:MAG: ExbD/TolR family protein [Desulforegulaceae bacterium]|nr:ExbD/TolR family protein [Desulforegulaceae bacterium]